MDRLTVGGREGEEIAGGLPAPAAAALRHYFLELESALGQRSLHSAMIDRLAHLSPSSAPRVLPFESLACWSSTAGRRAMQTRAALRRMVERGASKLVTVLYRVYGPRDPHARRDLFGDLAGLAEYTDLVEQVRRGLVSATVEARVARMRAREEERVANAGVVTDAVAGRIVRLEAELERAREGHCASRVRSMLRGELRAARARLKEAQRAPLGEESLARAARAIRIAMEREITTADALRVVLDVSVERRPGETKSAFAERETAVRGLRTKRVAVVQAQAAALLREAASSYEKHALGR